MLSSASRAARCIAAFLLLLVGLGAASSALAQSAPSIRGFVLGAEYTQFAGPYASTPLGQGTSWWFGYRPDIPQDPATHAEVPVVYGPNSVSNGGFPNGDDWPIPTNHIVYTTTGLPAVDLFNHATLYSKSTGAYPGISTLNVSATGTIGTETIVASGKHWGGFYGTLRGANGVKSLQGAPWSSPGSDYGFFNAGDPGYVQFAPGPAAVNFYIYDIAGSTPAVDAQGHLTYDLTSAPDNTATTTSKARGRLTLRRKDFGARWEYGIDPNAKVYANTFLLQGVWQIAAVEGSFTSVYSTSDIGKAVGTYGQPDRFFAGLNFNDFNFYNVVPGGVNTEKTLTYQFLTASLSVSRSYNACTNQITDTVTNNSEVALAGIVVTDTQTTITQPAFALAPGVSKAITQAPTAAYTTGGTATATATQFNIERAPDLNGGTGTLADTTTNVSGTPDAPVITANATSSSTQLAACASICGNVYFKVSLSDTTNTPVTPVTLTLTGTDLNGVAITPLTTITDAKGGYCFANILPGTYKVTETIPAGYTALAAVAGDAGTVVSSTMIAVGATKTGTAAYNNENFLLTKTGSLSGLAYCDTNNNGKFDAGEPILSGVIITLTSPDNSKTTATTDANGKYSFANLTGGTYSVSAPATVGDKSVSTGGTLTVTVTAGQDTPNNNFGYVKPTGSICGTVYVDADNNGSFGAGDNVLAGVTVKLIDGTHTVIATTTTDANGKYTFTGIMTGTYWVQVPGSFNGLTVYGYSDTTVVTNGVCTTKDFRYQTNKGSICGTVYNDCNNNSKQDSGEAGLAGVTVKLIDGTHTVIATTTTDSNGKYTFTGVVAGTYWVQVPGSFNGLTVYGYSDTTVVTAGVCTTKDFRFYGPASVSGCVTLHVWCDWYAGLGGITVTLKDGSGNVVDTACTDCNGYYCFSNVCPGSYTVEVPADLCIIKIGTTDPLHVTPCGGQKSDNNNFTYKWCWE